MHKACFHLRRNLLFCVCGGLRTTWGSGIGCFITSGYKSQNTAMPHSSKTSRDKFDNFIELTTNRNPDLYLYTILDQRRVDIIDMVEYGVNEIFHIYPLCGIFYSPWHVHHIEAYM